MIPDLNVIIVNWRDEGRTLRCLSLVRGWETLKPKVIVVDNESMDLSRNALREALSLDELICSQANLGYAGGNNLGIARALRGGTPFVLLLNSDVVIAEKDVMRLLDKLRNNPEIGLLGPILDEGSEDSVYIGGRDIVQNALTRQAAARGRLQHLPGYPLIDVDYRDQ